MERYSGRRKFSKRRFVQMVAFGASVFIAGVPGLAKAESEPVTTQTSEGTKSPEPAAAVSTLTVESIQAKYPIIIDSFENLGPDQLKKIDSIFSRLPKEMIAEDKGIPANVLEYNPEAGKIKLSLGFSTRVNTSYSDTRNRIEFAARNLKLSDEEATVMIVHEITHRNTFRDMEIMPLNNDPMAVIAPPHLPVQYQKSYDLLGSGNFQDLPNAALKNWAAQAKDELKQAEEWNEQNEDAKFDDMKILKLRMVKAIEQNFPAEVAPVLAEQALRLRGIDKLIVELKKIFPNEVWDHQKIDKLIDFVHSDLLYGQKAEDFFAKVV